MIENNKQLSEVEAKLKRSENHLESITRCFSKPQLEKEEYKRYIKSAEDNIVKLKKEIKDYDKNKYPNSANVYKNQFEVLGTQIRILEMLKWVFEDELKIEEGK